MYLDLSFFRELSRRFGAPGDFAAAYVIAHEIGHHIQSELGIEEDIRRKQQEDPGHANVYSVQLELQADCFAGVWARSTYDRGLLDPGDIEEGPQGRRRGRRRPARRAQPRAVDARLVGAARAVVPHGLRLRQARRLRHERRRPLAASRDPDAGRPRPVPPRYPQGTRFREE